MRHFLIERGTIYRRGSGAADAWGNTDAGYSAAASSVPMRRVQPRGREVQVGGAVEVVDAVVLFGADLDLRHNDEIEVGGVRLLVLEVTRNTGRRGLIGSAACRELRR